MEKMLVVACAALLGLGAVAPVSGQSCVGDCNGDGEVAINEIILAVSIALGASPLEQCAAVGPGPVGIDRLIASVNSALCACGPCPTPPPTRTPTATVAITATATRTPTPRPSDTPAPARFESVWREDNARLGNSSCTRDINTAVRQALGTVSCRLDVVRQGEFVEVIDCDDAYYGGSIDSAGLFRSRIDISEGVGSCSVDFGFDLSVNLSRSPSTATYAIAVDFSGDCGGLRDCGLTATTRWTRVSGTIASTAGAPRSQGIAHALAPGLIDAARANGGAR